MRFSWFRRGTRHHPTANAGFRPTLEALEDRLAPANFVVFNTNDIGRGSLRQAILNANATLGSDTISFNIAGSGTQFILLHSPLPAITGPVAIKGATQPGYAGTPLIEVLGKLAGDGADGLLFKAGSSSVDALAIVGFSKYGIEIRGVGDAVTRSYIGVTPTLTNGRNVAGGVLLTHSAAKCKIGGSSLGNVISDNTGPGVSLAGASSNSVLSNAMLENSLAGVAIWGKGSFNSVSANIISGNDIYGVMLLDSGTHGNVVASNRIGLNIIGNVFANKVAGVYIGLGASGNTIGGPTTASRNVISGNGDSGNGDGVIISGLGTTGNTISYNYVGVGVNSLDNRANGANGITVKEGASGNVISHNLIGFNQTGVLLDGATSNTVKANWIGLTATGGYIGNPIGFGLFATHAAAKNLISGNQIGNFQEAVTLEGPGVTRNLIQLNDIGLGSSGIAAANMFGVVITGGASGNTVGGASAAFRNVISNSSDTNVSLLDSNSSGNVVQSNYIGTDLTGMLPAPTASQNGIVILGAPNSIIGGVNAGNVVCSSSVAGIYISNAKGNFVQGNFIGTNALGASGLANKNGLLISMGGTENQIGGTLPGAGNVISGNTFAGIVIFGAGTSGNMVQGNRIGLTLAGLALGNGAQGVFVELSASNNLIGGIAPGAGNIIASNSGAGIAIGNSPGDTTCLGNAILGNSIFNNGGLGVDLGNDGATANHPFPFFPGPNDFQVYPVLSLARLVGDHVIIQGTLKNNNLFVGTFRIEFFDNSSSTDPSGHGEGKVFLGFVNVTTGLEPMDTAFFTQVLALPGSPGTDFSATATLITGYDANGNPTFGDTSEFCATKSSLF